MRGLKRGGILVLCLVAFSCDLELEETDSILGEEGEQFAGLADVSGAVGDLYGGMNGHFGDQANFFALVEVTSDELLVPTRGTDWGDNGLWRQLHNHTWNAEHGFVLTVWDQFNQNVFRASLVLDEKSTATSEGNLTELKAEAQLIRALSMWVILDLYGVAPFRDPNDDASALPTVFTRAEALNFVLDDIRAALPNLPERGPDAGNNRLNQAAANYLLAKVLLNAHIYDGSGAPSAANMQAVIDAVDAIEADGYSLQDGYFDLFRADVDNETIWYLPTSVGNRMWNGLHYNQAPELAGGGWNGFSTLAEFYDLFEGDPNTNVAGSGQEERRGEVPTIGLPLADVPGGSDIDEDGFADGTGIGFGFLIGQQYDADGTALTDRAGNPLVFTRDYPSLAVSTETSGIRVQKYGARYGAFVSHEIIFRYSDAHLMRAEAMLRMGGDATSEVNELRAIRGAEALASVSEQVLLDERGRELYMEFWRRNDLIRFGQYTRDWEFKDSEAIGNADRQLFPIPLRALTSNPNLTQNPGY